jgi:DNA-binding transcriptional ArsR family regulator
MSDAPAGMLPVVTVRAPADLKAFAHPTRVRILEMLIETPMTTKQLGDALGMSAAQAHYHLKFLERAAMVRLVKRREKAGVVEKYYRAVGRKYLVNLTVGTFGEPGALIIESLAGSMMRGAVAAAQAGDAAGEAGLGLVYAAAERARVPGERLEELLAIASAMQAAQEQLRSLGQAPGQRGTDGGGPDGGAAAGGREFELTLALYAAPEVEA